MLASAWSIILGTLGELKLDGLGDRTAQADLRRNDDLRARYLVLHDMVSKLVDIGQNKFAVLATITRERIFADEYVHFLIMINSSLRSIFQASSRYGSRRSRTGFRQGCTEGRL